MFAAVNHRLTGFGQACGQLVKIDHWKANSVARITDFVSPRVTAGAQQDIWARQLFFSHIGTANVNRVDEFGLEITADIDTHAFELPEYRHRDHSFVLELDPDPDAEEGPARLTIDGVPALEAITMSRKAAWWSR